jgi:hypothetical protein
LVNLALNVNGDTDEHTVGIWDIHGFNRQRGKILGPDGKIIKAPKDEERPYIFDWGRPVADLTGLPVSPAQALRWEHEQQLRDRLGRPTQTPRFSEGARAFRQRWTGEQH